MSKKLSLPQPIARFVKAINAHNTAALLPTLSENAVITDEGQEYRGIVAIKEWSDEKCIAASVTLDVVHHMNRGGKTIATLKVDGNFDKTGLPDPFLMDFHFTLDADKILALVIRMPGKMPEA